MTEDEDMISRTDVMTFEEAMEQYTEIVRNPATARNRAIIGAVTFEGIGSFTAGVLSSDQPCERKIAALEREFTRAFRNASRGTNRPMGAK